jgi:hypothetical protein
MYACERNCKRKIIKIRLMSHKRHLTVILHQRIPRSSTSWFECFCIITLIVFFSLQQVHTLLFKTNQNKKTYFTVSINILITRFLQIQVCVFIISFQELFEFRLFL